MKTLLALLLCTTAASAADLRTAPLPVKAPLAQTGYDWSGLSIYGYVDYSANLTNSATTIGNTLTIDLSGIPHGPGVGGGVRYLYQGSNTDWVAGVRAEIGYLNLQSTGTLAAGPNVSLALSQATNYLGSFNGVLGYQIAPQTLGYVTGGLAFGGAKPNLAAAGLCLAAANCSVASSDTSVGWDVGVGIEHALTQRVSIYIEGDYTQLGGRSLSIPGIAGGPALVTADTKYNIFTQKLGLNFKLGS